MKIPSKIISFSAIVVALLIQTSLAQQSQPGGGSGEQQTPPTPPNPADSGAQSPAPPQPGQEQQQKQQRQQQQQPSQAQQFLRASKLIGKKAKSAQGQDVAKIGDVVFNPQTGETFVLLDMGRKGLAPVPWQLVNAGAEQNQNVQVNVSNDVLNSAPTVTEKQWGDFNDPKFTQRIYAYYGVPPAAAMGGTGGGEKGAGQGQGQGPAPAPKPPGQK